MEGVSIVVAAVVSLAVTGVAGIWLVPMLRRLKFGQTINEIGPSWHQQKQGTPTMGGIMFAVGSLLGVLAAFPILSGSGGTLEFRGQGMSLLLLGIFTTLAFSIVGFVDDYLKVVRRQNLGLRARAKLVMQAAITACFLITLHIMDSLSTIVRLPFIGEVDFGIWFYPLSFLLIIGMVNAVNLTDGIDGLAASATLWVMCGYLLILSAFGGFYLSIWAAALAGGCAGFLIWNTYPAKVFMGDTGSMFLGGAVVALGYCMGRPDILIILGILYLIEAGSVMLQVSYFKLTKGKRIFKMTPIHHHFEMSGFSETKINVVFGAVVWICVIAAYVYAVVLG